jgi:WD40 repeat protein
MALLLTAATASARGEPPICELERPPPPRALTDLFGDPLPKGAVARLGTVRWRHAASTFSAAFTPDGATIVTSGYDGFRVWDVDTGKQRREFPPPAASSVGYMSTFSTDGKTSLGFLTNDGAGGLHGVDALTGKEIFAMKDHSTQDEKLACRCIAPDGKTVLLQTYSVSPRALERKGNCYLYDTATSQQLHAFSLADQKARFAFSSDGAQLLAFSDSHLKLLNVATGKGAARCRGLGCWTIAVAFSPDGKTLVFGDEHGAVTLFDAGLRNARSFLAFDQPVYSLSFSADGKTLAAASFEGEIAVWDWPNLHERVRFRGAGRTIVLSPSSPVLACAGGYRVHLYDLDRGVALFSANGHEAPVSSLAFSPDGTTLATASGDEIRLWDPAAATERGVLRGHTNGVRAIAYSPDGDRLASVGDFGDPTVRLWDPAKEKEVCKVDRKWLPRWVGFSPDGGELAFVEHDVNSVNFRFVEWDRGLTQDLAKSFDLPSGWRFAGWSPDHRTLAASAGGLASLDRATGKRRQLYEPKDKVSMDRVAWSPDGRCVAGILSVGGVVVLESATGQVLFERPVQGKYPKGVAGKIRLWDAATGDELASFDAGPGHVITAPAFSPNGRRLASGGEDTTILIWDVSAVRPGAADAPLTDQQLADCWKALAGADAAAAWRAAARLAADSAHSVPYLKDRLPPAAASDKRLARLVADLDADDFETREAAARRLAEAGEAAEGPLRKALEGDVSVELRGRAAGLLEKLEKPSPDLLRAGRALAALERMSDSEARRLLRSLADGDGAARLTRDARAALDRLDRRAAATPP